MKAIKCAAVALVLGASSLSAQTMARSDSGKMMKRTPAVAAKKEAMAAHAEAKAAEKTADKAAAMAKDAKKDALAANEESHDAMEKPMKKKSHHRKGARKRSAMMKHDDMKNDAMMKHDSSMSTMGGVKKP